MTAALPKNAEFEFDRRDRSKDRPTKRYVQELERGILERNLTIQKLAVENRKLRHRLGER